MQPGHLAAREALAALPAPAFAPLGIPLRIDSADEACASAVIAACRAWRGFPAERSEPLSLHLAPAPDLRGTGPVRIRVLGGELHLAGPGARGRALVAARRGWCRVSADYLADPARLRDEVLEPLALFLLTRNGRVPLHAAGLLAGDLAVLLSGPSGSGKSCLAHAADRAGLPVLSDDTVYLESGPALALWGWPAPAHLLASDLSGPRGASRLRNGRIKYAVPFGSPASGRSNATRAAMVLLRPGDRAALDPLDPAEALRGLAALEPGFDLLRSDIEAAHRRLTRKGAWRLTLSKDPDEAVALLRANLPRLRAAAAP